MDESVKVQLNNGIEMPLVGLGVFKLEDNGEVEKTVLKALRNGYRMIDTAYVYHNEEGVGRAIKKSGIPRESLFLSTKIGNDQQGYESVKNACNDSLKALHTDYLDLYLIHWPQGKKTLESWKAMEELYEEGKIRAIGVSNFEIHHLEYLIANSKILPAVNQVEFHPKYYPSELEEFCKNYNIQLVAWSPLMRGRAIKIAQIKKLAGQYNKTPAQVVLRWILQKGVAIIPKSGKTQRLAENLNVFDFTLTEEEMIAIDNLNRDDSLVDRRERIIHLLQMLRKQKFNKRIYSLLLKALREKVSGRRGSVPKMVLRKLSVVWFCFHTDALNIFLSNPFPAFF